MDYLEHQYNYAKRQTEGDDEDVVKVDRNDVFAVMEVGYWYFTKLIQKHKVGWRDWSFDENRKINKMKREIINAERVDSL